MMRRFCLVLLLITGCGDGDERDYSGSCPEGSECNIKGTALVFRVRPPFSSFFNRPWPADVRMTAGGTVDLSGFPHMEPGSMLEDWVTIIQQNTPGFGTNAAVYFSFDGPLDTNTLPLDSAETISGRPTAFLVDISAGPGRGEMIPLAIRFFKDRRQFTPKNTLVLRPVLGFPLRSSTTYAAVVTRGVSSESGSALGAVSDFERTKYESPPEAPDVRSWWEVMNPAYDELEELGLVKRGKVAALGVFTTQEVLDEMDRVREYIHAQPAPTAGNQGRPGGHISFRRLVRPARVPGRRTPGLRRRGRVRLRPERRSGSPAHRQHTLSPGSAHGHTARRWMAAGHLRPRYRRDPRGLLQQ
jgi:hypothetical protein